MYDEIAAVFLLVYFRRFGYQLVVEESESESDGDGDDDQQAKSALLAYGLRRCVLWRFLLLGVHAKVMSFDCFGEATLFKMGKGKA